MFGIDIPTLYVYVLGFATIMFYLALIGIGFILIADYIRIKKFDKKYKKEYNINRNKKCKRRV